MKSKFTSYQKTKPVNDLCDSFISPQAVELEEAVLGAILIEKEAYQSIEDILKPDDFYVESNKLIYQAIRILNGESRPVDMLTVTEKLKSGNKLAEIGGPVYIAGLTEKVGSSAHIVFHANIIKQKAIERVTITEARSIINKINENEDISDILFTSGKNLEELQESLVGKMTGSHLSVSLKKATDEMYSRIELARKNIRSGIDTGFADLNRKTNGWQKGDLIIEAGRPGMGKTAVALWHAKAAARQGYPVAFFSLEMSDVSLANRLILSEAKVDPENFKSGYMTNGEVDLIEKAIGALWSLPIYVDDNPCASMGYIRAKCRVLKKQGKLGLIIGDYLQLAENDEESGSREQEVAKMSRTAKKIAKELEVPFILLSQLNRGNESRADKKPLLSDLRESGAIEQDADIVIFNHRPEYYDMKVTDENGMEESNYGELIVAKHRNGATGTVKYKHSEGMAQFFDYNTASYQSSQFPTPKVQSSESDEMPF
ncbi:replicative DNA helicase [Dysgonomonas termitidis]|uniref:Replicative DNA helicase n=1 Tax=Dysgonomonas termitidis TaxID=1516126 RepID=A0ABV9L2J4_9BACT